MTTNVYNGDGKRTSQKVGTNPTTSYVYDTAGGLPVVLTDGGRKYVYGLGLSYTVDSSGTLQVYHADGLGSVRAITESTGNVIQTLQTDSFGVPAQSQGSVNQPFGFTGQQVDPSGLVYLRARFYDPTSGRFMTRDPLPGAASSPLSLNQFTYVLNNPISLSDPSGNDPAVTVIRIVKFLEREGLPTIASWVQRSDPVSKATAISARRQGASIAVEGGSLLQRFKIAQRIERAAFPAEFRQGDSYVDPKWQLHSNRPHFQTEDQPGHTFFSATPSLSPTSSKSMVLAEPTGGANGQPAASEGAGGDGSGFWTTVASLVDSLGPQFVLPRSINSAPQQA